MLVLISSAKTLDFDTPEKTKSATEPAFLDDAEALIRELQQYSADQLSELMGISGKLADLNHERFKNWRRSPTKDNAKPAVLAFQGDLYTGLEAESFSAGDFRYAQKHLRILSGLYGVLRPLDLMQPYRLEMGARFANQRGKDMYQFWNDLITLELNRQLQTLKSNLAVNLTSNEYFRSIHKTAFQADVISPAFKDLKNRTYKIISFYSKLARGQMAGWIIRKKIDSADRLKTFRASGYRYNSSLSTPQKPVFTRDEVPTT